MCQKNDQYPLQNVSLLLPAEEQHAEYFQQALFTEYCFVYCHSHAAMCHFSPMILLLSSDDIKK